MGNCGTWLLIDMILLALPQRPHLGDTKWRSSWAQLVYLPNGCQLALHMHILLAQSVLAGSRLVRYHIINFRQKRYNQTLYHGVDVSLGLTNLSYNYWIVSWTHFDSKTVCRNFSMWNCIPTSWNNLLANSGNSSEFLKCRFVAPKSIPDWFICIQIMVIYFEIPNICPLHPFSIPEMMCVSSR